MLYLGVGARQACPSSAPPHEQARNRISLGVVSCISQQTTRAVFYPLQANNGEACPVARRHHGRLAIVVCRWWLSISNVCIGEAFRTTRTSCHVQLSF